MEITQDSIIDEMIKVCFIDKPMKSIRLKKGGAEIEYFDTKETLETLYRFFGSKTEQQLLIAIIKRFIGKCNQLNGEQSRKHNSQR